MRKLKYHLTHFI